MKKMKTKNKCLVSGLAIIAMLMMSLGVKAQDVSIDPESGHLVTSVTGGQETGYALGLSALWRHEQLALSVNATDRDGIDEESGEISIPSAVLGVRNGKLIIVGGRRPSFLVVSLPKGYKITGYKMILVNDMVGANLGGNFRWLNTNNKQGGNPNGPGTGTGTMRFYEVERWSTNGTNSGTTGRRQQDDGYNENQVMNIALGTDWANGQIGTTANQILATATAADDDQDINTTTEDTNKEYTIERESTDEHPMGNQLYFRLVKDYYFYGVSIKSFVVYFTAEGTFSQPVTPGSIDFARRVVMSPFNTSKTDIGKLEPRTQTGTNYTYFAYDYTKVTPIKAYNYIYQARAHKDGVPYELESDANGEIKARITPIKNGNDYNFAFGNDTYFVEPPISVNTSSGLDAPIGYRIVGATFKCLWSDDIAGEPHSLAKACQIYYQTGNNNNRRYYYLAPTGITSSSLIETRDFNKVYSWEVDDDGNIFYKDTEGAKHYLACNGTAETRQLSFSSDALGDKAKYNLRLHTDESNRIYYLSDGNNKYYLQYNNNNVYATSSPNNNYLNGQQIENHTVYYGKFTQGGYTLTVYDKEGNYDSNNVRTINSLADATAAEPIVLQDLNNDAVKFSISGLDESLGEQAIVSVSLQLQALDPYINNMLIECKNIPKELQMSQTFTASNFKVSGGSFVFYVPSELNGFPMDISFSELYSDYGDNTYWGKTMNKTHSRYSFVTSDYFEPIDGYNDDGLYDDHYDPDAVYNAEGASKILTATAGNVRFKFNNAEDLGNDNTGSAYLEEYPFSVETYLSGYEDPDVEEGETAKTAKFEKCTVIAGDGSQEAGSFFVFTADETRWNIAPTTEWQHRAYAFYRMDVKAVAKSYDAVLTWDKIYTNSLSSTDDGDKEGAQFGLTLGTSDNGQLVTGYLTVKSIQQAIDAAIDAEKINKTGNVPTSKDQILYIDGSRLLGIYNYTTIEGQTATPSDLEDLKDGLGANALIFLPPSITSTLDNFATKDKNDNTFRAGNDIILTDKKPFYSPYDIQVSSACYATYTRELTQPDYGQAINATIMLPFTIDLSDDGKGTHTNRDQKCSFTVNEMATGKEMKLVNGNVNYGTAYFTPLNAKRTEANKPYMVNVSSIDETVTNNGTISFIATQYGSTIVKTPVTDATPIGTDEFTQEPAPYFTGKLIKGDYAANSYKGITDSYINYYFTNYGSYSGGKFDRAVSENVFYFAKDMYLDLHTLYPRDKRYLMSYPFRGVYIYDTKEPITTGAKMMKGFFISYDLDDMQSMGITTDLDKVSTKPDLMIRSDRGLLTITASRTQDVVIRSVNGMVVKDTNVEAGNTTTVALPAGIYLVNNTKITVK